MKAEGYIMEQNKRVSKRIIISLLLSAAIVIMEIIGLVISIRMHGIKLFQYYTQDSNLFAMISFAIGFYFSLRNLLVKKSEPRWSVFLRYISANCLALTFLVVIFVLAPTMGGYRALLTKDSMLYHHLLCPVAVFVHFVFFDHIEIADKKTVLFAQIPTFVYAVIILSMNIMRLIRGPYPFLYVYEQPVYISVIWSIVILGGAYVISVLILKANNLVFKRRMRDNVLNSDSL